MAVIPEQVRQQLKDRFETSLSGPVHLTVYTRPGSSRLILPAGVGCATCQDAREMAELLRDVAPEKITLEVVDVARYGSDKTVFNFWDGLESYKREFYQEQGTDKTISSSAMLPRLKRFRSLTS